MDSLLLQAKSKFAQIKNGFSNLISKIPGVNTATTAVTSTIESKSPFGRGIYIILAIIAFVILLSIGGRILGYFLQPSNPYIIKGMINANNQKEFSSDPSQPNGIYIARSQNQQDGIEFSWSVWINISNLNVGSTRYQHIFSKGNNDNSVQDVAGLSLPNNSPGLYITPGQNDLYVAMNTFANVTESVVVKGIPLNKWIHVVIRVKGVNLDVYVNGSLAQRKVLQSVPLQNNGSVFTTRDGGFNGYLSDLRYFESALQPGDIIALVNKGPNLSISKSESHDINNDPPYFSLRWYFQGK